MSRLTSTPLRSPLPWYGGKVSQAAWIARHLPVGTTYVEPFAGMASVLLARRRVPVEVLNDADGTVVNFWRMVRERPEELAHLIAHTPLARDELRLALESQDSDDPLIRAWAFAVVSFQGIARATTVANWRWTFVPGSVRPSTTYANRIGPLCARLERVQLECGDALELLRKCAERPELVIYCDPPYRHADTSPYREHVDHEALVEAVLAQHPTTYVAISGYPDDYPELDSRLWRRVQVTTAEQLHQTARTETLWLSGPPPQESLFSQ